MINSGLFMKLLGTWGIVLTYDWLKVVKGVDIKVLLYAAMIMTVYTLWQACTNGKQTEGAEA